MAEESGSDDRTEDPTPRRLQQATDEGQLPLSKDGAQVISLLAGMLFLSAIAKPLSEALVRTVGISARAALQDDPRAILGAMGMPLLMVVGIGAAAALGSTAFTVSQTRGRFWPNLLAPDPKRLFSFSRLVRIFQREGLEDLGVSMLRVAVIGTVVYLTISDDFLTLPTLLGKSPVVAVARVAAVIGRAAGIVVLCLVAFGVLDMVLSRQRFMKKMRMTKEDVKREYKEDEGDPLIKGRRKRKHRELTQGRVAVEVPQADVIVVNPTHIAIALRYRKGEDRAPRVTAKGKGVAAEAIRELARANGIPILEDIPLARLLHKRVKVGAEVPAETYRAVAAVLAFAYRVRGRARR